jgi:hypothetical protein
MWHPYICKMSYNHHRAKHRKDQKIDRRKAKKKSMVRKIKRREQLRLRKSFSSWGGWAESFSGCWRPFVPSNHRQEWASSFGAGTNWKHKVKECMRMSLVSWLTCCRLPWFCLWKSITWEPRLRVWRNAARNVHTQTTHKHDQTWERTSGLFPNSRCTAGKANQVTRSFSSFSEWESYLTKKKIETKQNKINKSVIKVAGVNGYIPFSPSFS